MTCLVVALSVVLAAPAVVAEMPPERAALVAGIRAALDRNDLDGALALGKKAVAKDPGGSETWRWLGHAYGLKAQRASVFSRMGLARKCKAAFEKAVALDPKNVEALLDLAEYHAKAPRIAGGDKEKALALAGQLRASLATPPPPDRLTAADAHCRLAHIYERLGRKDDARRELREALKADPVHERAKRDLERLGG